MKLQPILIVLTVTNLLLLIFTITQLRPAVATDGASVLRGRALQIVDDHGRVRASINVYPAKHDDNGQNYPETVLFRLITERGRPSVKLGVSEEQATLALVGPSGTKETYVQLGAKGVVSSLTLKNENGSERLLTP